MTKLDTEFNETYFHFNIPLSLYNNIILKNYDLTY